MNPKMNYKKAAEVSNWMFIASMAAIGGTFFFTGTTQLVLFAIGIGLIVAAIVVRIVYWRCPNCKKMLKLGFRQEPNICPRCRANLLGEEKKK